MTVCRIHRLQELGEKFEELERKLFGKKGFETG